jgi:dihydrofolate synthase / folylpolyglutamate synthase
LECGRAAVIGERDPRIRALLASRAMDAGASPVRVVADETRIEKIAVDDAGTSAELTWRGERTTLRTPLTGRHQISNLVFSLTMLDAAGPKYAVSPAEAARHLDRVRIPGRFQHTGRWIFDVAHNAAGAEVLAQTMTAVSPPMPITVVLCVLRDKDWRSMIRVLSRMASRFILTMAPTAPASRAWDLAEAEAFARGLGLTVERIEDFGAALDRAQSNAATVLVTGSFHTVGDAMSLLQVSPLGG